MRYCKSAVLFASALLVQTNFLNLIAVSGYTPNLCLALVIVFSFLLRGEAHAVIFGAVSGIVYDMAFSPVIGPTALALLAVCAFIRVIGYTANNESCINMIVFGAGSISIYYFLRWLLLGIAGDPRAISIALRQILYSGSYTLAVVLIIFTVLLRIRNRNKKHGYKRRLI